MPDLEIKLHSNWKKLQLILFIVTLVLIAGLIYMIYRALFQDPLMAALQILIFLVLMLQSLFRVRYLKALYIRIDDAEVRWRLIAELEIWQRMRPPISEAKLAWDDITRVRNMATGMYFTVRGEEKERYLPLSNFSYAQRQDIKHAIAARLGDDAIEDQVHAYVQHEPAHPDAVEGDVPNEDAASGNERSTHSAAPGSQDKQEHSTGTRSGG